MFSTSCIVWFIFVALVLSCDASMNLVRRHFSLRRRPPSSSPNVTVTEGWFTQRLDHFLPTDTRTWKQRFRVVEDYYQAGGPVFLMLEGEAAAEPDIFQDAWADYAKNHNALMFQLEHRYYGESQPTSDLSVENLKYLTSEQALADAAYFIVAMKSQHKLPPNTKWVAFGGSYAGNLAAWVRLKYPHLVHASVASSAPVQARVDFPEFLDVVKDSLATYSSKCVEAIEAANKQIIELLKTPDGEKTISELFQLCDPIDSKNHNDVMNLLDHLEDNVGTAVQHDGQGVRSIQTVCSIMANESLGTPIKRFADLSIISLLQQEQRCLNCKYDSYIKEMRNIAATGASRQWKYQVCTEFGYLQTSESKRALFGEDLPLNFYIQKCQDIFGKDFTKELLYRGVDRSNVMYGGLDLQATRVVHVHGSIDPWHALGITKTRIPQSPAIFVNGTSHCADLMPAIMFPGLKAVHEQISALIGKWLQEP